jgi:hypothetical protein
MIKGTNQKPETRNQKWRLSGAFLVSGFWFLISSEVRNA